MLDHLHVEDHIEPSVLNGKHFGSRRSIVDFQGLLVSVSNSGLDVLFRGIDAGDAAAKPGHGLRQESAAAADIENIQAGVRLARKGVPGETGGDLLANIGKPDGVELVEDSELSLRIPPLRRETGKPFDFRRFDA